MQKMTKMKSKILAGILVFLLVFSDFAFVGKTAVTYAIDTLQAFSIFEGSVGTGHENVEFDAYFKDSLDTPVVAQVSDIQSSDNKMYVSIEVKDAGYLKDAKVEFASKNNDGLNFKFVQIEQNEFAQNIENNTLNVNQVNYGSDVEIVLPFEYEKEEYIKLSKLNEDIEAKFSGIYVTNEGEEVKVEKSVTLNIGWTADMQTAITSSLTKYVPFDINGTRGLIVQTLVETEILNANNLPIKTSTLEVGAPEIKGTKPNKVVVTAKSTEGTNGKKDELVLFGENNWKYDSDAKVTTITVDNKVLEDGTYYSNGGTDKYLITYTYPAETLDVIGEENVAVISKVVSKIERYSNNETKTSELERTEGYELARLGEIVSYSIEREDDLNKGLIYANYNNEENIYETEIKSKQTVNIAYKDIINELRISDISETFKDKDGKLYDASDIFYKKTVINKNNMKSVLGEDGFVEIKNQNGDVLAKFDKDTTTDELENMTYNYEGKLNKIVIQTSKPVADGNLIIDNTKAIKEFGYSKQQFRSFEGLITKSNLQAKYDLTEEFSEVQVIEKEIKLAETTTNAEISIDKESLSTLTENKDVEIRIVLNNDKENSDLYENPVFEMVFPEHVKDVRIKNANILYGEGLEIQSANSYKKGNNYYVKVKLVGQQKKFSEGTLTNGTNIVITADIDVETYTPAKTDEVVMFYMNENVTKYASAVNGWRIEEDIPKGILSLDNGYDAVTVSYAAPTGMVAVTNLSNFNKDFDVVSSINEGRKNGKLEIYTEAKQVNAELIIMNNNGNVCKDISILGRVPSEGAKSIVTGTDLASTHNATLLGAIEQNANNRVGFEIYYSTNLNATKDLENSANGWTKEITDFSTVRSFLMVATGYEMQNGDILKFNYRYEIPANLEHNSTVCGTYAVYFNNITKDAVIYETKEADIVGLSTGEGPQFDVVVTSNLGNDAFAENQVVEYTVKATNTGKTTAKNVVLNIPIPTGTTYVVPNTKADKSTQYREGYIENPSVKDFKIEEYDVNPGESLEHTFKVRIGNIPNDIKAIYGEDAYQDENGIYVSQKYLVTYKVKIEVKDGVETYTEKEEIKKEETTLTTVDGNVKKDENGIDIIQEVIIEKKYLEKKEYKVQCSANIIAKDLEKQIPSNIQENVVTESFLEMGVSSYEVKEELLPGFEFTLYVHATNLTNETLNNVEVEYDVPQEFEILETSFEDDVNVNTTIVGNTIKYTIPELGNLMSKRMTIKVKVKELENAREIRYVDNVAYGRVNNTISVSNDLTYRIATPVITIVLTSESGQYLKENETLRYKALIKNEGVIRASVVKFEDVLPSELIIKKAEYQTKEGSKLLTPRNNKLEFSEGLNPGETIEVIIEAVVGNLNKKPGDTSEISNYATADGIASNKITNIVEQVNETKVQNSNNQSSSTNKPQGDSASNNVIKNTITGLAWNDENKNGKRDAEESFIKDVRVNLIDSKTEATVAVTNTNSNGIYIFQNIDEGTYLIVFEYDSIRYGVTEYHAKDVNNIENSDAIVTKIDKDDIKVNAAITDSITLAGNNVSNIDIGLIKADIFDLSLEENVTKITTKTSKETKEVEANHVKLAKTDIHSKLIEGAEVIIEHTIVVKNEGEVAGTASRLVSYISSGLEFEAELNPEWYEGSDGNVYTSALENATLQPGESKEFKLYLSKTMTATNTGLVNNTTEIKEDYNIYGISDIDSIAGNRSQKEDDISSADTIITPGTGAQKIVLPIIFSVVIGAGVIGLVVYMIKKKSVPSNKRRWV